MLHYGIRFRMENDFCERSFRVGEIVMNENTIESDERVIQVYRGNKLLTSPTSYYPKEKLKVSLSVKSGDIIFQVENATFVGGGCEGRRTTKDQQTLLMPSDTIGVRIWAGWASEHGVVKISKDFYLQPLPPPPSPSPQLQSQSESQPRKEELVPLTIPRDPIETSEKGDKEYLKARNSIILEKRRQTKYHDPHHEHHHLHEEEEELEEEEEQLGLIEEFEEEEEEEGTLPSLKAGMKHFDTMSDHLRGVVQENVPSEFHDLLYLSLALFGLLVLYLGMLSTWRCCRFFGFSNEGKSE